MRMMQLYRVVYVWWLGPAQGKVTLGGKKVFRSDIEIGEW